MGENTFCTNNRIDQYKFILKEIENLEEQLDDEDFTMCELKGFLDLLLGSKMIKPETQELVTHCENYTDEVYIFIDEEPRFATYEKDAAKVALLMNVFDIFSQFIRLTSDMRKELKQDINTILTKDEPYIPGCGQIAKIKII